MIEDEILSDELVVKTLLFDLSGIFYNPALQLEDILESLVFVICTGLLTADASCTIHDQVLVFFMFLEVFLDDGQGIAEGVHIRCDRSLEMPDLAFVVVAHIDQYRIGIFDQGVELFSIYVHTLIGDVKSVVIKAISDDLVAHLYFQFEE